MFNMINVNKSKNLIIQIYGREDYKETNYTIEDKSYKTKLISEAWVKHLGEGDILMLVPESLVSNVNQDNKVDFIKDYNYFENYFSSSIKKQLIDKSLENKISLIKVQSISSYSSDKKDFLISYENNIDNIMIYLFKDLLKKIYDYEKIVIDLSTGLNIYVEVLMDTLRYLVVYLKIKNFLADENNKKTFIISLSPPYNEKVNIYHTSFDTKAFFDFPQIDKFRFDFQENSDTKRELNKNIEQRFNRELDGLKILLKETRIAFNGIKYNTPLIFYNDLIEFKKIEDFFGSIESQNLLERSLFKILDYLEDIKKIEIQNSNRINISRYKMKKEIIFNMIIVTAIYDLILNIKKRINKPDINQIEKTFNEIYDKLNLKYNNIFLEKDIKDIMNLKELDETPKILSEIIKDNNSDMKHHIKNEKNKSSKIDRNFFAHSGFEYTITKAWKKENTVYLEYNKENFNDIREWLYKIK